MEIAGAHVVVTGATGGLGQAVCRRFDRAGAQLTLTARRSATLDALADELDAAVIAADLADLDSVRGLCAAIRHADILVANAGLEAADDLVDLSPEAIAQVVSVNLQAPALLAALVAPDMAARGRGHIVLMASMAGKVATLGNGPLYTA